MKRLLALLLIITSLLSVSFAEEIFFRSMPWGISMAEIERIAGFEWFMVYDDCRMRRWNNIEQETDFSQVGELPSGWEGYSMNMTVAGYEANVTIYCAYGLTNEGVVLRGKSDSVLYAAGYDFNVLDKYASYTDLKEKMTTLYGEGSETIEEGTGFYADANGSSYYNYQLLLTQWDGANDTQVKLFCILSELDSPYYDEECLVLWYGKTDADAYLDKLQTAIYNEKLLEENKNRNDDMSGL